MKLTPEQVAALPEQHKQQVLELQNRLVRCPPPPPKNRSRQDERMPHIALASYTQNCIHAIQHLILGVAIVAAPQPLLLPQFVLRRYAVNDTYIEVR